MVNCKETTRLNNTRIIVVAPNMSHPRYHRRVSALLSIGYQVTVYSFERGYYNCNAFPPGCEVVNIGHVKDGHYFERIFKILHAARKIYLMERDKPRANLLYAFELDCALLGTIVTGKQTGIIYEIGDLRSPTTGRGILDRMVQYAEEIILKRSKLFVNTSDAFIDFFLGKRCYDIKEKVLIIENKLPNDIAVDNPRPLIKNAHYPLKIGYIGLLRYEKSFLPLLNIVAEKKDSVSLHIHGDGPLRAIVEQKAREHSNIHYHGPFRNPEDLSKIYNSIDLCYVVYDNNDLNVRLALPNKLYEATYFCVPLLVATDTALYVRVKEWDVGWAVDPQKKDFLERFFNEISLSDIDRKKRNASEINQNRLIENWDDFFDRLQTIIHL